MEEVFQAGRKHCRKRRNCSLRAISPFPSVFKRFVSQGRQKVLLCGNGLSHYHTIPHFDTLKIYSCGKHGKTRCVCELVPPKHPSFEKHDPDI